MPSFDEREHLVKEFCKNTGASDRLARDVLTRNRWDLSKGYNEVQQMCVSGNRASSSSLPPPPSYSQYGLVRPAAPSRGGMEGGIGPAVSLDTRGVRPPVGNVSQPVLGSADSQIHHIEGLKVALPPVRASTERVIPIKVEGGRTMYQAQPAIPSPAMARITLDEKVLPSQPVMVAPKLSGNNGRQSSSVDPISVAPTQPAVSSPHESYPRLKRGFSSITENELLVKEARSSVLQDIKEDNHSHMFMTFVLPDLDNIPDDFRAFLMKELIESSTLSSLEMGGHLNWWAYQGLCQRLFPMATSGDGNCLLHAASLAMWGIHDRLLTLRNALHHSLTSSLFKDNLYRRWRWQQTFVNQQSGLVFSEPEWKTEWENILRLASPSPRCGPEMGTNVNSCCDSLITSSSSTSSDPVVYESLEEFHVFVLAHVLKRPIIVVADTILRDANGEALAPIPFGGIYLPLECQIEECYTSPLLLTYDAAHFSALVPMQHGDSSSCAPLAIPVVDFQLKMLPLHFCHDPGPAFDWNTLSNKDAPSELGTEGKLNLMKAYLDILQLPLSTDCGFVKSTSRQSSSGSEEGVNVNSGCVKDKKKDGKHNTVAKQFGSLGKTVGKKLKNLGNNLAPSKAAGGGKGGTTDSEKDLMSLGCGLSQSAKVITALATTGSGENEELVHCARLWCEHEDSRQLFVDNYMKDAQKRFLLDQQSQTSMHGPAGSSQKRTCRTVGCSNYVLPDTSLCDACSSGYQWQHIGTLDRSHIKSQGQQPGYNTFPGRHKPPPTSLPTSTVTSDEIYKCGKSKFYASHPQNPPVPLTLQVLRKGDRQQSMSTGNVARDGPLDRPRSPSPDYDNHQYRKQPNPHCATVGCDFYGSKETDYLCSGCYKKIMQQSHLAKPEKTTPL